jgi:hypothetical protein
MHPKWLAPRISLSLSVLSLIIGLPGVFAVNKWWVLILIVPPVFVFLLTFRRLQNVPCRPDCWLNPKDAKGIYATAVAPEQGPICAQLTVEHSAGVAVAALTARAMLVSIMHLKRMLLLLEEEIQKERIFSCDALDTFTRRIQRIQAITAGMVCGGNFSAQCYLLVPNTETIIRGLDLISKSLMDAFENVANLRASVPVDIEHRKEVAGWGKRIRGLLIDKTCPIITENVRQLDELATKANGILVSLGRDWNADIRFLWDDSFCKPPAPELPPEPRIRMEDVARSEIGVL